MRLLSLPGALPSPTSTGRKALRPSGAVDGRKVTDWIVRSIILATTTFAMLDLLLLLTSLRH